MKRFKALLFLMMFYAMGMAATVVVGQVAVPQSGIHPGQPLQVGYVDITVLVENDVYRRGDSRVARQAGRQEYRPNSSGKTDQNLLPGSMVSSESICLIGVDGKLRCGGGPEWSTSTWSGVVRSPSSSTSPSYESASNAPTEGRIRQQFVSVYESAEPLPSTHWPSRFTHNRKAFVERWGQRRAQRSMLRWSRRH